ncbi:MAG: hypothetical protein ACRC33_11535, partial [Gemmataceae bacterium]
PEATMSEAPRDYRYHPAMQILAVILFIIPLAALYVPLAVIPAKELEVRLIVGGLIGMFLLFTAPLVWEAAAWRLRVTDEGLECRSPWRGSWTIRWDDVKRLEWSQVAMWFIVVTPRGRWFRFSYAVGERDRLMAEFERRLKPEQMALAETGYLFIQRPWPFRRELPIKSSAPPRKQAVGGGGGIDLSKWGDRRR